LHQKIKLFAYNSLNLASAAISEQWQGLTEDEHLNFNTFLLKIPKGIQN
jgi:hypothetical protein